MGAIVGCDGAWSTPGMSNGGSLCGTGWHLCVTNDEVSAKGLSDCGASSLPTASFYATDESSAGGWNCNNDEPGNTGSNDIWGCGDQAYGAGGGCSPLNAALGNQDWNAWKGLLNNGISERNTMYKEAGNGGVMCCHD